MLISCYHIRSLYFAAHFFSDYDYQRKLFQDHLGVSEGTLTLEIGEVPVGEDSEGGADCELNENATDGNKDSKKYSFICLSQTVSIPDK